MAKCNQLTALPFKGLTLTNGWHSASKQLYSQHFYPNVLGGRGRFPFITEWTASDRCPLIISVVVYYKL